MSNSVVYSRHGGRGAAEEKNLAASIDEGRACTVRFLSFPFLSAALPRGSERLSKGCLATREPLSGSIAHRDDHSTWESKSAPCRVYEAIARYLDCTGRVILFNDTVCTLQMIREPARDRDRRRHRVCLPRGCRPEVELPTHAAAALSRLAVVDLSSPTPIPTLVQPVSLASHLVVGPHSIAVSHETLSVPPASL